MALRDKKSQVAVLGMGRFGTSLAQTLASMGCEVLAVDREIKKVESISNYVTHALQADVTDEENLKELGLRNFDKIVIAIGSHMQDSIIATLIIQELGVKEIIVKASSDLHRKALEKIGVSRVVYPEKDSGIKLAHSIMSMNLIEYLDFSPDYHIAEIIIQDRFDGKTLKQTEIRNKFGVNILAIRSGDNIKISPNGNDVLYKGDLLVVIGKSKDLANFSKFC